MSLEEWLGEGVKATLPEASQNMTIPPNPLSFAIHFHSVKADLRFPPHPLVAEFLNSHLVSPCQLTPNVYRSLVCFLTRCYELQSHAFLTTSPHHKHWKEKYVIISYVTNASGLGFASGWSPCIRFRAYGLRRHAATDPPSDDDSSCNNLPEPVLDEPASSMMEIENDNCAPARKLGAESSTLVPHNRLQTTTAPPIKHGILAVTNKVLRRFGRRKRTRGLGRRRQGGRLEFSPGSLVFFPFAFDLRVVSSLSVSPARTLN
nr:Bromodomain adjacent to zinc finger domain 1A [Ipomoea batatas]